MLQQDRSKYGGQGAVVGVGTSSSSSFSSSSLRLLSNSQQQPNRKREKDSNFNFLGQEDEVATGDENRNQMRPRSLLGHLGRELPLPPPPSSGLHHHGPGPLSPLSRLPCWSPLEPLPEIESGDDCYGRVPPDGAEEGKMEEEETGRMSDDDDKEKGPQPGVGGGKEPVEQLSLLDGEGGGKEEGLEEEEELEEEEDGEEWGDSDSEFEFCYRSGGSLSSLNMESGGEGVVLVGGWDRVGVGETETRPHLHLQEGDRAPQASEPLPSGPPPRKWEENSKRRAGGQKKSLGGLAMGSSLPEEDEEEDDNEEEGEEEGETGGDGFFSDSDTDPCGEVPELPGSVWTLRDRQRFKAQEMEKHQAQLTMYRRLALIRWVRTLQSRVQEQQNRLQSSFDVILHHRKELLRMGAAAASQS